MTREQFFRWNIITNVCMALSINTAATLLAGGDSLGGWVTGCCCAFTINTVAAILIPVGKIGAWFAQDICRAKEGGAAECFARNFMVNAIFVTIVSFFMALLHVGIGAVIPVWLATYVQLHITGLITSLVIEKPVAWAADKWK